MALLLEGNVPDDRDTALDDLQEENERLESEVRKLRTELIKAKAESEAAIAAITALRNTLGPLYRALRGVFGEINLVVSEDAPHPQYAAAAATNGRSMDDDALRNTEKWEGVKRRLGGKEAELIDALLTCGPRTNTQLKSLLKLAYSTTAALTLKMANLGFLSKEGDAWALKK